MGIPPRRPSLKSYTPTLGEQLRAAVTNALSGVGVDQRAASRFSARATNALTDLTPLGMVDDLQQAYRTVRGALPQGDYGRAAGGMGSALMAVAPIPGPAKKLGMTAASRSQQLLEAAGLGHLRGDARKEAKKRLHEQSLSPTDIARREQIKRERDQEWQARMGAEQERRGRLSLAVSNAPILGSLNAIKRGEIMEALQRDPERAFELGPLAVIEAVTRRARAAGWQVRHTSNDGRASSRYLVAPNGQEVRLSDHALPATPQREASQRERGTRWAGEVVIGRNWTRGSLDDWMAALAETAGLK